MRRTIDTHVDVRPGRTADRKALRGPLDRYSLLIPLCLLGILIANLFSLMITNNGLIISDIFPDLRFFDREIPQTYATFVFAGVLQFGILVLYLLLAVSRLLGKLVVIPFLSALVAVSFYFGFLSVHANARGDAYLGSLPKRIDNLLAAIEGENRYITNSVHEALAGSRRLAEASRQTDDKTGIAACGALCQGYYDRAEAIRSRYGHLLAVPQAPQPASDLRAQWRAASAFYAQYASRSRDFARMLREQDPAGGYEVNAAVAEDHDSMQRLFGKGMEDRWMIAAKSLRDIGEDAGVAISALISILPDVISLFLSLTISVLLGAGRGGMRKRRAARAGQGTHETLPRADPAIGSLPVLASEPIPILGDTLVTDTHLETPTRS